MLDRDGRPRRYNWRRGDWDYNDDIKRFYSANNIDVCSDGNLVVTTKNGEIWAYESVS